MHIPEIAGFLDDTDPTIVLEAARAIAETDSAPEARARLAAMASRTKLAAPLWRRILWANEGIGPGGGNAKALATIATRDDVPDAIRVEALDLLAHWNKPSPRHPITGLWRDAPNRPEAPAVSALASVLPRLVGGANEKVRKASAKAAGALGVEAAGPALRELVADAGKPSASRVEALMALDALKDAKLAEVVQSTLRDAEPSVRVEAVRILAKTDADAAIDALRGALDHGPTIEKQGAFATLSSIPGPKADALFGLWLDRLRGGEVVPEIRLDLADAASSRSSSDAKAKLDAYESSASKDDPLASYRDTLVGGSADRGRKVFREKAEVQCLRCHKVEGDGGEVGPELTGIGEKKDRAYLLESIVLPNKQIAQGFETQLIATTDGRVIAGIVKAETDMDVRLMTADGKLVTIPKDQIDEKTRGNSAMPEDIIKELSSSWRQRRLWRDAMI